MLFFLILNLVEEKYELLSCFLLSQMYNLFSDALLGLFTRIPQCISVVENMDVRKSSTSPASSSYEIQMNWQG